jgi:hypothetical protein
VVYIFIPEMFKESIASLNCFQTNAITFKILFIFREQSQKEENKTLHTLLSSSNSSSALCFG